MPYYRNCRYKNTALKIFMGCVLFITFKGSHLPIQKYEFFLSEHLWWTQITSSAYCILDKRFCKDSMGTAIDNRRVNCSQPVIQYSDTWQRCCFYKVAFYFKEVAKSLPRAVSSTHLTSTAFASNRAGEKWSVVLLIKSSHWHLLFRVHSMNCEVENSDQKLAFYSHEFFHQHFQLCIGGRG